MPNFPNEMDDVTLEGVTVVGKRPNTLYILLAIIAFLLVVYFTTKNK